MPDARDVVSPWTASPRDVLIATDAAEYKVVKVLPYIEILGMRNQQVCPPTTALRDRGRNEGMFLEEPRFWRRSTTNAAASSSTARTPLRTCRQRGVSLGAMDPGNYANIRDGRIGTGYTECWRRLSSEPS